MAINVDQKDIFAQNCLGRSRFELNHVNVGVREDAQYAHNLAGLILAIKPKAEAGFVVPRGGMIGPREGHKARNVVVAILDIGYEDMCTG